MKKQTQDNRSYARVVFNRKACLTIGEKIYRDKQIRDLSLIGLYLQGRFDVSPGAPCTVEIQEDGPTSSLTLTISATVVRVEESGIGLKFENMKQDSYMFLQTMILYATRDPVSVAEEFLEDFPPTPLASN